MSEDDEVLNTLRDKIEAATLQHFTTREVAEMPVLGEWVLVATVRDLDDPNNSRVLTVKARNQAGFQTIGLLTMANDMFRYEATYDD